MIAFLVGALLTSQASARPQTVDGPALVARLHVRLHDEPVQQEELNRFLELGKPGAGFLWAFAQGEELFEADFTALDGGGANVGNGERYTRLPRADLAGPGQWARHLPARHTGPNASSCTACHDTPANDGSGGPTANVHRDPRRDAELAHLIQRNTPHLFGAGAVQRLAEEMTRELWTLRDRAANQARGSGKTVALALVAHGVSFGTLAASPGDPDVSFDLSALEGVDADLVVRPFQWKGNTASLREFTRNALNEELGLQALELVGQGQDGDFDGVRDELTVGDVTALTVYVAGQPRPTTRVELAALGFTSALPEKQAEQIRHGEELFRHGQCTTCHVPELVLADTLFREPSAEFAYRDARFPAGQDPRELGLDPEQAIAFDLLEDLPDNVLPESVLKDPSGTVASAFGNLQPAPGGGALVALFGDLKRHDLGPELAESIDETGTGRSTFLTENLWGVGSTAPYLHDGRATTLTEAILAHGGEAAQSRAAFVALPAARQTELIRFLENLVLFKLERVPRSSSRNL